VLLFSPKRSFITANKGNNKITELRTIKADFMQGALRMKLVLSFNFTFCYDYFLSLNNSKFGDFVDRLYPIELEIEDTT
jgi:hypothetical protein